MKTDDRKQKKPVNSRWLIAATLMSLVLCSSCRTPPSPDDGIVGILYHAAARHEARNMTPEADAGSVPRASFPSTAGTNQLTDTPPYRLSPGDIMTVNYFARPTDGDNEYVIGNEDVLTIRVAGLEAYNGDVTVRPDGRISFFLIGDLAVRGSTVAQVRAAIIKALEKTMPGAEVTVILKESEAQTRRFLAALKASADINGTHVMHVRPDGKITLPLIGEVSAMGSTLSDLTLEVEGRYDRILGKGLSVSLNLTSSSEGNIAVLGDVHNPGRYTIAGPVSPFFALAMAGGALESAQKSHIVVVKRQEDGRVGWHVVNLDVNSSKPLGPEIALGPQDMLLVPRTGIADLNLFVEQYIRNLIPFGVGYTDGNWRYTAPR